MKRFALVLFLLIAAANCGWAHSMLTAYLDLAESADGTTTARWRCPIFPGGRITLKPVFPAESTCTPQGPPNDEGTFLCERSVIQGVAPLWSGARIGITGQAPAGIQVLIRLELANGKTHLAVLRNSSDVFTVPFQPNRWQSMKAYVWLGFEHILLGFDHLLFVFGLLILVPNRMMLIKTITSFTIAHSLTLGIATLGYASAPMEPLSVAIALSIFFLAPEIVRMHRGESSLTTRHPWFVAFMFGLLHGFGFASGLTSLGLPKAEIPVALLLFNVGVELGQLVFVLVILQLVRSFRSLEIRWGRIAEAIPCYTIGGLGAFWTFERLAILFLKPI